MEVTAAVAAGTSLLIFAIRCLLVWKLVRKALEEGVSVEVSGHNPLAPTVKIMAQPHRSPTRSGESKMRHTTGRPRGRQKSTTSADVSY